MVLVEVVVAFKGEYEEEPAQHLGELLIELISPRSSRVRVFFRAN
jgi:hypothetical protein